MVVPIPIKTRPEGPDPPGTVLKSIIVLSRRLFSGPLFHAMSSKEGVGKRRVGTRSCGQRGVRSFGVLDDSPLIFVSKGWPPALFAIPSEWSPFLRKYVRFWRYRQYQCNRYSEPKTDNLGCLYFLSSAYAVLPEHARSNSRPVPSRSTSNP